MKAAVDEYLQGMRDRGLKSSTVDRVEYHLVKLLELGRRGSALITSVRPALGQALYDQARTGAVDTHRNALGKGKAWGAWCVARGYLKANPFAGVEGVGRRKRGKPKINVDDSRKLLDLCLARLDQPAIAVMATLLLGNRASEITDRNVRDVDDGGRLLWISDAKTPAGCRALEVPLVLRPHLKALATGRPPTAPLLVNQEGRRRSRYWLHYWTRRLCSLAGVPVIPPHGLRGTHATIARVSGVDAAIVAAALGHASPAITEAAYIDQGEAAAADRRTVLQVLQGGRR